MNYTDAMMIDLGSIEISLFNAEQVKSFINNHEGYYTGYTIDKNHKLEMQVIKEAAMLIIDTTDNTAMEYGIIENNQLAYKYYHVTADGLIADNGQGSIEWR